MFRKSLMSFAIAALLAASANAQIVIDGVRDAAYGSAVSVQTVETGFGDNQSEWNAVYANISGGKLNILVTGNLEDNFNKLEVFFDSRAGGENVMSSSPEYDFFDGGAWTSTYMGGMTFDTGFGADYHMYARAGFGNFEVDFIDRLGGGGMAVNGNTGAAAYDGVNAMGSVDPGNLANGSLVGNALSTSILFAMDNSNVAGIGGGNGAPADQDAARAVTTGYEFSIALSELNLDSNQIRLAIMQNNSDHNYLANQNFDGLPIGTGNLGGDGAGGFTGTLSGINFNNFAGTQFITIKIPEPGSTGLILLAGVAALIRRRR